MKRLLDYNSLRENKIIHCKKEDKMCCANCNGHLFNRKISCTENGQTLSFDCENHLFYKIKVDDDVRYVFLQDKKRCDFIIVSEELTKIVLWVELKGKELDEAIEQLESSIKDFGKNISKKYAAIVCSRVPKSGSSNIVYIEKFKQKYDTFLFIKSKQLNLKYNPNDNTISKT